MYKRGWSQYQYKKNTDHNRSYKINASYFIFIHLGLMVIFGPPSEMVTISSRVLYTTGCMACVTSSTLARSTLAASRPSILRFDGRLGQCSSPGSLNFKLSTLSVLCGEMCLDAVCASILVLLLVIWMCMNHGHKGTSLCDGGGISTNVSKGR